MEELAYSFHIGSDKNRKPSSKNMAKNNPSGTTSLSNNAIQNARQLSRVDKHNYRKYDNEQELIEIIKGTSSLYDDVVKLYEIEFEEARIKYNEKQTREDRKIDDYFKKVSDNSKNDLAVEIIIELGDKKYWDTKDDKFKHKMSNVFKEQVKDLGEILPNFKIASAIIHYDETSPHLHIVGVPIKEKNKNGMEKQVGKSDVFTKNELFRLQDKMRALCIAEFNKEYGLNNILKTKQKGRNRDINVKDMINYQKMKEELDKNKAKLEEVSEKSTLIDNQTKEIKETINKLKKAPIVKNTYTISEEDKNKIIEYVDKVEDANNDFKKLQKLSITLNNVDKELQDNKDKIKVLTDDNYALKVKLGNADKRNKEKDKKIKELEHDNSKLQLIVNSFKKIFNKLFNFFYNKMFGDKKEREKYYEVANELLKEDIFDKDDFAQLEENYIWNEKEDNKKSKDRDDFEI